MARNRRNAGLAIAALMGLLAAQGALAADFGSWQRSLSLTFPGYTRPETLTNFPALVVLSTNIPGFSYSQFLSGANSDLRFADATGTNELNYEIEQWDANGLSYVWVQVPRLTNSVSVQAFWGLAGQTQPPYTTNGATWTAGFRGVWHMGEAVTDEQTSGLHYDSSTNRNTGSQRYNAASSGIVGGGQDFDGSSDQIDCGNPSSLTVQGDLTLSAWIRPDSTNGERGLASKWGSSWCWVIGHDNSELGRSALYFNGWKTANSSVVSGQWNHVVVSYSDAADNMYFYLNGKPDGIVSQTSNPGTGANLTIGQRGGGGSWFDGLMDEVRVEAVTRSSNWIWAAWMNTVSNGVFATTPGVQIQGKPRLGAQIPTNVTWTGASLNVVVASTGMADTVVTLYWGETDGGTNAESWAHTNVFAAPVPEDVLTAEVSLTPGLFYFYRCLASNQYGQVWASSSASLMSADIEAGAVSDAAENGLVPGTVTVFRASWLTNDAVTVYYSLSGTASNGVDYVALPGSVVIPAGETSAFIAVTPRFDSLPEGPETVTVTVEPGAYAIGVGNTATINLTNFDPPGYYYVTLHGSDATGAGTPGNPWRTPQFAVTNAASFGEVRVGEGLYVTNVNFTYPGTNSATVRTNLTLKGGYNTNDWTWSPAAHPTILKPATNTQDVIHLGSPHHRIVGFTLTGGSRAIFRGSGANINTQFAVEHCVISNNASHGIWISMSVSAVAVRNCLVVKNGGDGIRFNVDNSAYGSPVHNCTIADNAGNGIFMQYLTVGVDLRNSIVVRNGQYGLQQNPTQGHQVMTVSSSSIYGNTLGDFISRTETLQANAQAISVGAGVLAANPRFAAAGDYHLSSDSPCVDRGTVLASVSNDLELAARPAAPDMGCYESAYAAAARSAIVYVDAAAADDTGDGTSWATAKKTVGSGLAATASSGVCWVAAGAYRENAIMPAGVTLSGTNRDATILYQTGAWHVVTFAEGAGTLRRMTVTGGVRGADLISTGNTVEDCALGRNAYGVYVSRLLSVLNNCYLTNNTYHAVWGAGLSSAHARGIVARNCLIAGNGNSGIYIGWDNGGSDHTWWLNCTIVSNGVHGYQSHGYSQNAYFTNTILALNRQYGSYASGWGGDIQYANYCSAYGNPSGTFFNVNGGARLVLGANMLYSDPAFMSRTDFHLTNSSPLIDAGQNLSGWSLTNDLDGLARTNAYDIGCFETAFSPPPKYDEVFADIARPDDTGEGTNWATAKKTIAAAQGIMTPSGTCYVAAGLYNESVSLPGNTALIGADRETTVISNSGNVVTLAASGARVREVTLVGGSRGVSFTGPSNRVERCIIRNQSESAVNIQGTGNRIVDSTLRNCLYGVYSAGVNVWYDLDRCVVMSNTSHGVYQTGGGANSPGSRLYNSLVVGNGGDGLSSWTDNGNYDTYLFNCTIADNAGHGIYDNYLTRNPVVRNCIVANNGLNGFREANSGHYYSYINNSCFFGNRGGNFYHYLGNNARITLLGGNFTADPLFMGPGDYQLQAGSPCIGYGATNGVLGVVSNSIDGAAWGVAFDMGCYKATNAAAARLAATYVNGATGSDAASGADWGAAKKTLGSGLAVTAPGGTCYAAAGTYSDTVILPARVTLEGASRDSVIVTSSWYVVCMPETNSVLRRVTARNGLYGVYQNGKFGTVDQCALRNNALGLFVDGVQYGGWNAVVDRTLAVSNASHGVYALQSGLTARNSLFALNGGNGVLIVADNPQVYSYMDFCTFANNTGSGYEDNHASHWRTAITNCIAAGNGVNGIRFARLNTDVIAYSCVYGNTGGDFSSLSLTIGAGMITNQLPGFAVGKFELNELSPCLDVGAALLAVTNDVLGVRRPIAAKRPAVGTGYDLGAYEFNPPPKGSVFLVR